ncbi:MULTISPECIES: hypothetical protein [unclassified Variovorax]|uniref:hypothetical protein n=1 Tax=unclassified Variovorax TaxID=663243 RepID=UPI003F46CE19
MPSEPERAASSPVLSDDAKERIRLEEIYREEVRTSLTDAKKKPTSFWAGVWSFFNTSLGIWFLSSVLVASGSWWFTRMQEAAKIESKRAETREQLSWEVVDRLMRARDASYQYRKLFTDRREFRSAARQYADAVKELDSGVNNPNYFGRSFRSLLHELRGLVGTGERVTLTALRRKYEIYSELANSSSSYALQAPWEKGERPEVSLPDMSASLDANNKIRYQVMSDTFMTWLHRVEEQEAVLVETADIQAGRVKP